ncbi:MULTISPECIES: hypothetical protein [unclassified Streptomyces]|uniref:hypothetical protein n=1 Tax=unclassified Streptomyces TaxID=2593676 RepID=UPI002E7FE956|nr:hypothetical protein [Streptomyces sp. NBC_00503]WUD81861.1 hypothetical protein OG490_15670 [Streptomyces sp. NBC_00503]
MPTGGMTTLRQLKVVDAVAELGGDDRLAIPVAEIADKVGLSPHNVSSSQGFLRQAGLLETHHGSLSITTAGFRLTRLRTEDSARARLFLHDHWQSTWFTKAAKRLLRQGPRQRITLAEELSQGLPATAPERGLYLVDWLDYALIVHVDEDGMAHLPGSIPTPPPPAAPASGLFLSSVEATMALPDDTFVAAMQAYGTLVSSLRGPAART